MAAIEGSPQEEAAESPAVEAAEPQPVHQATGPAASKLHDLALGAEKNLEGLATGLAQAHADTKAISAVTAMANTMRQLLSVMAKQAQAEPPPAPKPTIDSATRDMVASARPPAAAPPH